MRTASAVLVATGVEVLQVPAPGGEVRRALGLEGARPTCLAADPGAHGRAWCGTAAQGVFRSDDGGASWDRAGLGGENITAVAVSPAREGQVWIGTEPSTLWRSDDVGETWRRLDGLLRLPSSAEWSFPPRPDTHHVRWIACHPHVPDRLWLAIEAGALIATADGGISWKDRVPGGPYDTHELAIHPRAPEVLRSAAGDGYYESPDGGLTWTSPMEGLDVGYLRSVAIDPGDPNVVVISAASRPRTAYMAGRSDGRLYRREGDRPWRRVHAGWPEPPDTVAPLLCAGSEPGELWAADERGVHRSDDGGRHWQLAAAFEPRPSNLRGLAVLSS